MNIFDVLKGKKRITIEFVSEEEDYDDVVLIVEVATKEKHLFESSATQYPVEDGVNISDHIIQKGMSYDLSGLVSDDPIDILQEGVGSRFTAPFKPKTYKKIDKIKSGKFDIDRPSQRAFAILTAIYLYKLPVNITTDLIRYKNMVMESVEIPRDGTTSRALKFDAKFRQVKTAKIRWTSNLAPYEPVKPVTKQTTEEGSKGLIAYLTNSDTVGYKIGNPIYNTITGKSLLP